MGRIIFTIMTLIMLVASQSFATFELVRNTSPRGISLGSALVGEVDPINGILYNPASVAYSKMLQWQGIFGMDYTGFDTAKFKTADSVLVVPFTYHFKYEPVFKNLVFGFSFNRLMLQEEGSIYDSTDGFDYHEQMFTISFGKKMENLFSYGTLLSLGVNINILDIGIKTANSDIANNMNHGATYFTTLNPRSFGIDLGATYYLNKVMVIGGMIENLVQPNVKFNNEASNPLLTTYQLGLSMKISKLLFMKNITALASMSFKNWEDPADIRKKPAEYHFGYEFIEFEKLLAVRLGYQMSKYGASAGSSIPSIGIGLNKAFGVHEIQFDYSFQIPFSFDFANTLQGTYGTHKFALTYNWSWPQSYFEFDETKREELRQIEEMKKQYQLEQKEGEAQKTELKKDEEKTGSIETANADPDTIMKKANVDRNTLIQKNYLEYTKQRDTILASVKKTKDAAEASKKKLLTQVAAESNKLIKAKKPEDQDASKKKINELNTQIDTTMKDANKKIADFNNNLATLKANTSKAIKDIESDYAATKKKFGKKTTENFKEEDPTVDMTGFNKELSGK